MNLFHYSFLILEIRFFEKIGFLEMGISKIIGAKKLDIF